MADQRRKKRKPFSLQRAQLIGTNALAELERILVHPDTGINERIRAANGIASLLNAYSRITETADIEKRLTALEVLHENKTRKAP